MTKITAIDRLMTDPKRSASRRSSLFHWLRDHRDQVAKMLAEMDRPNWTVIAKEVAADGVRDGRGHPPSGECLYRTWRKVMETTDGKQPAKRRSQAAQTTVPPAPIRFLETPERDDRWPQPPRVKPKTIF